MTKKELLDAVAKGEGPLGRSHDDEPVFVLVGRDRVAPTILRIWSMLARLMGAPTRKCGTAVTEAIAMDMWQKAHGSKVPD